VGISGRTGEKRPKNKKQNDLEALWKSTNQRRKGGVDAESMVVQQPASSPLKKGSPKEDQ
jgi:hypothetical protein